MNLLSHDEMIEALEDAGFSKRRVAKFSQLTPAQQSSILNQERSLILARLHASQRQLECLDYLRYQLK